MIHSQFCGMQPDGPLYLLFSEVPFSVEEIRREEKTRALGVTSLKFVLAEDASIYVRQQGRVVFALHGDGALVVPERCTFRDEVQV